MSAHPSLSMQSGWLMLESADTPMHVGGLLYFKLPKGAGQDYVQTLFRELQASTAISAPWNCRLGRLPGAGKPRWVTADDVDLDYHLRHSALPSPGGEREVGELIARLHGLPLDLRKPLWECHLIEGLADRRFALYLKVHPALMDGSALIRTVTGMFTNQAAEREPVFWSQPTPKPIAPAPERNWSALGRALRNRFRDVVSGALPWAGEVRAPHSVLNGRLSAARRFATQQYDMARLQHHCAALDIELEELILYLVSSAVRRFMREYNALPDADLIALIADRSRRDGQLSPLFVSLGTSHGLPRRRLDVVSRSLQMARREVMSLEADEAQAEGAAAALPYLARQVLRLDHRLKPMFNLGMVMFDGPQTGQYWGAAKLQAFFPMPMLLQGGALNIGLLHYAGQVHVGLMGARERLPHLQRIAVYMGRMLDELDEGVMDDE